MQSSGTARLRIHEIEAADLMALHELNSFPETDRYNTLGLPESLETTERILFNLLLQKEALPRLSYIFHLETEGIVPAIGFMGITQLQPLKRMTAEVWYKIHPQHWGNGFATEALLWLLRFGFKNLGLHRIEAACATGNTASARVLEKAGMLREGLMRKVLPIRGTWVDAHSYAMLEEDLEAGAYPAAAYSKAADG